MLNSHKAMLLQTLSLLGNDWCDSPNLIKRFMRGIFILKPALPRYKFTWDVTIVLKLLSTWYPLETLNLKFLTLKVTALIALACAPRAQTIMSLDLNYMKVHNSYCVFYFPNLLKTSVVGKENNFCVKFEHFRKESLCVYHTLLYYIKVTEQLRLSDQLLISYVTFNAVTSSTIARWLKTVLQLSGIDVAIFKAHSFRGASVSAAARSQRCSIKNILNTAGWKSDNNFYKFYYRPIIENEDLSFSTAVFSSK